MLSPDHRKTLLHLARTSISESLEGRHHAIRLIDFDEPLRIPSGAFVTLRKSAKELRGCIGSIHPVAPLCEAVAQNAFNAAFRDPRFLPLRREEFPMIDIEISVMGPIQRVSQVDEIEVGRDGLIVTRGHRAGLLLPQVASEYGWDRATFLKQTCFKAGLPPDAWQNPDCRIERFPAEVFGEIDS